MPITSPLRRWPRTRVASVLGVRHPIIQGPFGSGLSSVELAAAVSNTGGLGTFGVHHLEPAEIVATVERLRERTGDPFAVNLWVSTHDVPEADMTAERWDAAVAALRPLYEEFGAEPPSRPERFSPTFAEQVEAVLTARPPVFSWVYGIPESGVLDALRERGIITVGTAITPDEAVALDEAGVDLIVASGAEAGGHRVAFLGSPSTRSSGRWRSSRSWRTRSRPRSSPPAASPTPGRSSAALALGAEGVQIGTAFLATDQSGAPQAHKDALHGPTSRRTGLTRACHRAAGPRHPQPDVRSGPDRAVPLPGAPDPPVARSRAGPRPHRRGRAVVRSGRAAAARTRRRSRCCTRSSPRPTTCSP